MKKLILLVLFLFIFSSCSTSVKKDETEKNTKEKIQVVTSIVPLASIVNYIAGDYAEAKSLVPSGVSPHGFDLKANQMVDIENADMIVYLGLDHIDGFMDKALEGKTNVIAVNKGVKLLESKGEHHHEHEDNHEDHEHGEHHEDHEHEDNHEDHEHGEHHEDHEHEDNHEDHEHGEHHEDHEHGEHHEDHEHEEHHEDHEHEDNHEDNEHGEHHENHEHEEHHEDHEHEGHSVDPHIWTSSNNSYIIAKNILDKLVEISPENKEYFEANLKTFKTELDTLKTDFESKVKSKNQLNFIVFHDAYKYLFDELSIDESKKHIFRKNMISDPNSSEMKKIIDEIKEKGIKVAFKEPQLDANNLKKIASEYNLNIYLLNPLGLDETKKGYINNYKNNLESLLKIYE